MEISIGYFDAKGSKFWESFQIEDHNLTQTQVIQKALEEFDEQQLRRKINSEIFIIIVEPIEI